MEGSNPVKSFGPAKGLNASKFFDRIRFRDVAALVGAIAVLLLAMGISSVSYKLHKESTEALDNHARVEENSELTYYLTVNEDGVDSTGKQSSDTVTANISGGMTSVTDRLPDGLEFVGFVTTEDGTIGAAARSDSSIACGGHVIDDTKEEKKDGGTWNADHTQYYYHGLHYDVASRTVSFRVENVRAGCGLTVGIITKTPSLGTNKRLDFYNTANLKEGILNKNSNTMHVWMGRNGLTTYDVTYAYTGTVPENAPAAPETQSYVDGATVQVAGSPIVDGYQFSGWTTSDTETELGHFAMPASNVAFTGSFTQKSAGTKYDVTYVIDGAVPEGYVAPKAKQYEAGSMVKLDSTRKGHLMDKYVFSGWSTEDVTLEETGFVMPAKNVVIHGSFEERKYTVSYEFEGEVMPPNAEALLPEAQEYLPGTKVTRAADPVAEGYKFTGWYKNESFIMPEENVVIYGEWSVQNGVFSPEISKKVVGDKAKYMQGDTVVFETTVKNTANYPISDVQLLEELEGAVFVEGDGYTVKDEGYALVNTIPAGGVVTVRSEYYLAEDAEGSHTNTVRLVGATADGGYNLDTSKEYVASADFETEYYQEPLTPEEQEQKEKEAENAKTLDRITSYVAVAITGIAGIIASAFMIRRTLKNDQFKTLAPKAKTSLQGLKNFLNPKTATKGRLLAMAVADVVLVAVAAGLVVKLNLPQKIAERIDASTVNLMSSSANYDAGEGGAWKITKSAKWTGDGKAQLTIDVDTVAKNANGRYTDVLFVVDVSGSMDGAKIDRVKQDMTELTDSLMSNGQNQVAMVSFESGAKKELDFTTDKTAAQTAIDNLSPTGATNYYQAFRAAERILDNYQSQSDRDLFLLFLTDGYPNKDTPNEQTEYAYLKTEYPNMVVNAIQYEMSSEILDPIKTISDNQYIANMNTLNNVLFEASHAPYFYETLTIEDSIDTRYFEVDEDNEISSLNPSLGIAELTSEGDAQTIYWNMDTLLRSGQSANLIINLKLKDQYRRTPGEYSTNQNISAVTSIPEIGEDSQSSKEAPVLKNYHNVIYDPNSPNDCSVENMPSSPEAHFVFEAVESNDITPTCAGYNFNGFVVTTGDMNQYNDDYLQMHGTDVRMVATWEKSSIKKSADGQVYSAKTLYKEVAKQNKGTDKKIDFTKLPSTTNGNGVLTIDGTENDDYPVYYYRGNASLNNNVLYAGYCWKTVRTTSTGGVKIIYNGLPTDDGECTNGVVSSDGVTDIGRYEWGAFASGGYMYGKKYWTGSHQLSKYEKLFSSSTLQEYYWFSDSVEWDSAWPRWQLISPTYGTNISDWTTVIGQYTPGERDNTWSTKEMRYIVGVENTTYYYISFYNGNNSLSWYQNKTFTYGDAISDNGDGTYTIENPTTFSMTEYPQNYSNIKRKFVCRDAVNDACSKPVFVDSATAGYWWTINPLVSVMYSNEFTYSDGLYHLSKDKAVSFWNSSDRDNRTLVDNAHYTCFNESGECEKLNYIHSFTSSNPDIIILEDGESIEEAINTVNSNILDSTAKAAVDEWYEGAIKETEYESYLEDTVFCNDRSMADNTNGWVRDGGDVTKTLYFSPRLRAYGSESPTIDCETKNNAFSVNTDIGNGALKYPIGLLTADEIVLAGQVSKVSGTYQSAYRTTYLYTDRYTWTMSPAAYSYDSTLVSWEKDLASRRGTNSAVVRPVVSISNEVVVTGGNGSSKTPWTLDR